MPIVDTKRGVLVVRVVYDGPPMSGKTTSLRSLARGLGVKVTTPEERNGRTLFFDWMDYVGGLYEGRQIRCQIVSAPGQRELAARRHELLASADSVILVADTRAAEMHRTFDVLRDLLPRCRAQQPPVGIVLQANKRDAPDSVSRASIQSELESIAPLAIVDTVATTGDGVREAFVLGVRLALDRVRALAESGKVPEGRPAVDSATDLLELLRGIDEQRPEAAGASALQVDGAAGLTMVRSRSSPPSGLDSQIDLLSASRGDRAMTEPVSDEERFVPDPKMPGGFIWPPVDGRVILHGVAQLNLTPMRTPRGDWWASADGYRFHSAGSAIFADADLGRQALIEWARLHATNTRRLSAGRTVILAKAGSGRYRLWQLVRVQRALRDRLAASTASTNPDEVASDLCGAAAHLLDARELLHTADLPLPCTLWTISGDFPAQPRFVGLMPQSGITGRNDELHGSDLLAREFMPVLRALGRERSDFTRIVAALERSATGSAAETPAHLARLAAASNA